MVEIDECNISIDASKVAKKLTEDKLIEIKGRLSYIEEEEIQGYFESVYKRYYRKYLQLILEFRQI